MPVVTETIRQNHRTSVAWFVAPLLLLVTPILVLAPSAILEDRPIAFTMNRADIWMGRVYFSPGTPAIFSPDPHYSEPAGQTCHEAALNLGYWAYSVQWEITEPWPPGIPNASGLLPLPTSTTKASGW